jgi:phenylalanyl-tRNA synthetase beta chain
MGFSEIFTNSITNSKYYDDEILQSSVKMINNLSADLDIMRPSMLETMLETVAFNINRRNKNLRLFEFGKTYSTTGVGKYKEEKWLALAVTGQVTDAGWRSKERPADLFFMKGVLSSLLNYSGANGLKIEALSEGHLKGARYQLMGKDIALLAEVSRKRLQTFDIKQPVWFAAINWNHLMHWITTTKVEYAEIPKYPAVERDLALLVNSEVSWLQMSEAATKAKVPQLQKVQLFDIFESEKLGAGKKSMALSFLFQDAEKTMTEADIDAAMQKISRHLEKELNAEVRK